jgi:hypothetical protein
LENLEGISDSFYGFFLEPLVKKCANYGLDSQFVKEEMDQFCDNVKVMNGLLTQVNDVEKKIWFRKERKSMKLGPVLEKIPKLVLDDLRKLKLHYDDKLLSRIDINPIEIEINQIDENRRNSWYAEFEKSVDALNTELKKEEPNISTAHKLAYKMLLIGEKMYDPTFELDWAYRQFAANSMVYAIRLDARNSDEHGKIQKGDIQQIAHGYLFHMANYELFD